MDLQRDVIPHRRLREKQRSAEGRRAYRDRVSVVLTPMAAPGPGAAYAYVPSSSGRRLVVFDTNVLTSEVIAVVGEGREPMLLDGMRHGTIRGLMTYRVWAEVPRVLEDRARKKGGVDLKAAQDLWWSCYVPVLFVVDVDPEVAGDSPAMLAASARDADDAPTLALALVLAPVALLSADKDLLASGAAFPRWGAVAEALRVLGFAEQEAEDLARLAWAMVNVPVAIGWTAAEGAWRLARTYPLPALVGAAALFEIGRRVRRRHPKLFQEVVMPAVLSMGGAVLGELARVESERVSGETGWRQAVRGEATGPMRSRVARLLALRGPMTRTQIIAALGDVDGLGHRAKMDGLLRMLRGSALFVEVSQGRWQVGKQGAAFGHPAAPIPPPVSAMVRQARRAAVRIALLPQGTSTTARPDVPAAGA